MFLKNLKNCKGNVVKGIFMSQIDSVNIEEILCKIH